MPTNTPTPSTMPADGQQTSQQMLARVRPTDQPQQNHRATSSRRPDVREHPAVAQLDGPRAALRHRLVVRDHQHRRSQPVVQIVDQLQDLRAGLRIQIAGGLIGQQNRRINAQRACDRHALALAAGEFVGQVIQARRSAGPSPAAPARVPRPSCAASRADAAAATRSPDRKASAAG